MPDDLKQRIREIEESARKVDKLAMELAEVTQDRKAANKIWKAAVAKHMELCRHWEDSAEVADRPLVKAIESKAGDVAEDTFAALRSVGHTDEQARRAVERALASGKAFGSVNDMIDFIYNVMESPDDEAPPDEWGDESFIDPDSTPETNGVEETARPKRRRKAKA